MVEVLKISEKYYLTPVSGCDSFYSIVQLFNFDFVERKSDIFLSYVPEGYLKASQTS